MHAGDSSSSSPRAPWCSPSWSAPTGRCATSRATTSGGSDASRRGCSCCGGGGGGSLSARWCKDSPCSRDSICSTPTPSSCGPTSPGRPDTAHSTPRTQPRSAATRCPTCSRPSRGSTIERSAAPQPRSSAAGPGTPTGGTGTCPVPGRVAWCTNRRRASGLFPARTRWPGRLVRARMDLGAVIHSYGGPVLFVWAWLQGEAAVIVGGSLAAQGYWPWWAVSLAACVPAISGHQLYFALGRRYGDALLAHLPRGWQPAIDRARALVRHNDSRIMLLMRFAYGVRLPLPILCGTAGVPPLRFLRYNVGTALAWALLFTWLGYAYGAAATAALGRLAHYEAWILLGAVALGLGVHALTQALGKRVS